MVTRPWQMDAGPAPIIALCVGALLATWRLDGNGSVRGAGTSSSANTGMLFVRAVAASAVFVICAASLAAGTYNPFIYFRF